MTSITFSVYVPPEGSINTRSGLVKSTKRFMPWKIIHLEEYKTAQEAKYREQYWKSGAGRRKLKQFFEKGNPLK